MKILIMGGTGYLGFNILDRLIKANHEIFCVVRKSSDLSKFNNFSTCNGGGGYIDKVKIILNDLNNIEEYFKNENFDWIINAVCAYRPNETLYADMFEANMIFPLKILNLASKYNVKNYMTMGTSLPDNFNMYSFSKSKLSDFGRFMSGEAEINFIDLKLEMFYGGLYEPLNRFMKSCVVKLKNNEPLLLTAGLQKRDIIHVDDVVSVIIKILNSEIFNGYISLPVGSGEQHSIRKIIEFLKKELNSNSLLNFGAVPSRKNEPDTLADTGWYKNIDYKLKYSFFDGLKHECLT